MGKPAKRRPEAVGCAVIVLVLAVPFIAVLIVTTMVEAALEAKRWFSLDETSLAVWVVVLSLGFVGAVSRQFYLDSGYDLVRGESGPLDACSPRWRGTCRPPSC